MLIEVVTMGTAMRGVVGRAALLAAALLAAACGSGDAPVGGLSADEAAQLNNAAEMLDAEPAAEAGNGG